MLFKTTCRVVIKIKYALKKRVKVYKYVIQHFNNLKFKIFVVILGKYN